MPEIGSAFAANRARVRRDVMHRAIAGARFSSDASI